MNDQDPLSDEHGDRAAIFPSWLLAPAVGPEGEPLPSHHNDCLGCGQANPHGHHLVAHRDGATAVVAEHTFDARHVGAAGVAHGGAVATVLDDLYGFTLYLVGELAVTRHLTVEYLRPVVLGSPYQLRAQFDHRAGRKLHLSATLTDPHGQLTVRSEALFVVVDVAHFHRAVEQ